MDLANYLSFLGAAILLTLAPGPDNMYILTKSLSAGPRQGVTLAMGLATGPLWHTLLVMAGVAAFIQSSPASFMVLKYCGAAYLLYLSYGAFRSKGASIKAGDVVDKSESFALYKRGFKRGFLMNASNPKVLLFFLAILPQFVQPNGFLSPSLQIGLLGLTFSIQAAILFSIAAICAGQLKDTLIRHESFPLIMSRVEGMLLLLIAIGLMFL
ncbi:LysE family translocator [Dialister hominis]|jgi:threonine/homoserine/homoserine lactone efflux protein|uniref:LysE family translocator n=1 Tax=Dialister hominis TaxID=2582419 RepID=UPI003AEF8257